MVEGPLPKTWGEAWPLVTWGVLIFTAGFEGISHLIVREFVSAGIAFAIMVALMATLLHWREIKERLGPTNPNLSFIAIALMLFAVIVSPFVEQRRWPFSFSSDVPSDTVASYRRELDTQKTTYAAKLVDLTNQIASLNSQLDAKTRELNVAQHDLQNAQNLLTVPVLPTIDIFSGQQKNLFVALKNVFGEISIQQAELSSMAHELLKANIGLGIGSMGQSYYVPPCRIIVSSTKENQQFAKLIETIASQQCPAEDAPAPPPPLVQRMPMNPLRNQSLYRTSSLT
jgi:hypothetical protein